MSYCSPLSSLCADVPPYACRQSRLDSFLHADPAPQVTLYRTHSVRRISEHQCSSQTPQAPCFRRARSIRRQPAPEVCPSRPTGLPIDACCGSSPPRCQSPQRARGRVSVHCSPVVHPERTVRFGSCTSIASCDTPGGRILYARRSSPSPCRRGEVCCSPPPPPVRGRDSSICRVISRSSSPCEEILTASLPSRASCTATSSNTCNATRTPICRTCTSTSGCSPLRKPTCRPKPQRNLKYHYMFENNCPNREEDLCLPPPPPPEMNCCVSRCRTPTPPPPCEVAVSSCFDSKPGFCSQPPRPQSRLECCSTTTSSSSFGSRRCMERMTTRHRLQSICRQSHIAERWANCLDYINRKEDELVCQLNECDLDLSAFAGIMRTEVTDFLRDVIGRGRALVAYDLPRFLDELCCCMPLDMTCSESENFDQLWKRTEERIRDLDRLLERVNRMRFNGWLE
ncbi:unnamed protein product [Schistocephalus solidus]|uniref:Protein kinase domain-containing protein n=1 Tax=Schistocephalus solidus TaxID=70667 RepID=A0A183T210_SCHSO|nr:unnamed protein product [Schistocephalus solidus]